MHGLVVSHRRLPTLGTRWGVVGVRPPMLQQFTELIDAQIGVA